MHAFARGTPPGSSSDVTFRVARAFEAELPRVPDLDGASVGSARGGVRRSRSVARASATPTTDDADDSRVIVIEFVADRFLRKLVRCLCATAAREAASHAGDDEVLLRLAEGRERRAAAPPAPALGLVFAGVEYDE